MKLETKLNSFAQEGGFTLIEMLIVVAIIGILVAIAVPALNTAKSDAQAAKLKAVQSAVGLAINRAVLKTGSTITSGADVAWADISQFLIINGAPVTASADLSNGITTANATAYAAGIAAGEFTTALDAIDAPLVYP